MLMLAERVDHVIGVDTHRDRHSAAVVAAATGAVVAATDAVANPVGAKRLLRFAKLHCGVRRTWAIESSASFGADLTAFPLEHGEHVVEIDPPGRPGATARSPTNLTRFAPPARRSRASISPSRAGAATAQRSAFRSSPAAARSAPAPVRSTISRRSS